MVSSDDDATGDGKPGRATPGSRAPADHTPGGGDTPGHSTPEDRAPRPAPSTHSTSRAVRARRSRCPAPAARWSWRSGTSEQFAAAFTVLGLLAGLPTRVVVGFRAAAGTWPVRAGDALAWPEVLFDGLGWVPFDPLPAPLNEPSPVEEDFRPEPAGPLRWRG